MAGLNNLLNIGKVGLLAQQTSLQTIGHNISNVNTSGYSRQDVSLSAKDPTPTFIGPIGNGVEAVEIVRAYDRFITQTLFGKTSDMSGLEARVSGMQIVEGTLNEVEENGINGLLENFWSSWDDLSNNAESMAERTTILQKASALAGTLKDKYNTLAKLSSDIDLNIDSSIKDVNQISGQIAELNVQIVSAEAGHHSANDLRDQRDQLVNRLSQLANIHYFETERGSYTILIGQGSPLVEDNKSWNLEMRDGKVNWLGNDGQEFELTTEDIKGGELGGWLDIKQRLEPRDPTELTSSAVNTAGGKAVKLGTLWSDVDGVTVTGSFNIAISGTDRNGAPVSGTYDSTVDVDGDGIAGTIADFASFIEGRFGGNVQVTTTPDGRLLIKDINPGDEPISFQIDDITGGISGLDLGKFDGSYPLSYVEKLNQIGTQLIKYVNAQHSQGAGLIHLHEATANNKVINAGQPLSQRSSGLDFAGDVQDGTFKIWLYDDQGNVIDADTTTPDTNDPVNISIDSSTTMSSLAADINSINGLRANSLDGRLVVSVDGTNSVAAFGLADDSSNILMALGMNSFFTGHDAATIGINQDLVNDPRLIAAAQIQGPGAVSSTGTAVAETHRALGLNIADGDAYITVSGPGGTANHTITVNNNASQVASLDDILSSIQSVEGIERAWIEEDIVHIKAETGYDITGLSDSATPTNLWDYLGMNITGPSKEISGSLKVDRTFDPVDTYDTGVNTGSLSVRLFDSEGRPLQPTSDINITINSSDSLEDVRARIDSEDNLRAVIEDGRLQIYAAGEASRFAFLGDQSGLLDYLNLSTPEGGTLSPANNLNALAMRDLNRKPIGDLDDATLSQAYQNLVGTVGIHTRTFKLDLDFTRGAVSDLQAKREDISGVSIDEELSNLLKFQHAYTAAAKLIKAADEMFLSLLQTK